MGLHRKTHEQFLEELAKRNPRSDSMIVLGRYAGLNYPIDVACAVCGHEWSPASRSLLAGSGCPKCANARRSGPKAKTHEWFLGELEKRNPHSPRIEVVGTYSKADVPISVKCRQCGFEWRPTPYQLLSKRSGCPRCARREVANKHRKSHETYVDEVRRASGGAIEVTGVYSGSCKPVDCKCILCGFEWSPIANHVIRDCGCPKCRAARRIEQSKKKIRCVETGEVFLGRRAASDRYGIKSVSVISNAIRSGGCAAGLHWEYVD